MELLHLALCFCFWLALRLLLFRQHSIPVKTMVVLGSGTHLAMRIRFRSSTFRVMAQIWQSLETCLCDAGGHTAELFRVMDDLDKIKFAPRVYVVALTDKLGAIKARQHEQRWACLNTAAPNKGVDANVHHIPRSREVGQSWATSAISTAWATAFVVSIVLKERPGLLLVNGPGTCLPVCIIVHMARCLGLLNSKIVFIESIARTRLLSLTGKIMYHCRMSDLFLVQWPGLQQQFPRSQCLGRVY
jgi:beta-1,4-N-acetylglucosaminyltransferase